MMAEGSAVNELQRITVSPEVAARIVTATNDTDVTALLPRVRVPTLVMHARDDARVPFDAGRRMAAGIPGTRLVTLPGRNHLVPSRDGTGLRPARSGGPLPRRPAAGLTDGVPSAQAARTHMPCTCAEPRWR